MDNSFGAPESIYDVLLIPVLAVFFGILIRFLAWNRERQAKNGTTGKWLAILVVAVGVFAGFQFVWSMMDPLHPAMADMYRQSASQRGRRIEVGHYVAFGLPMLVLVAMLIWNRLETRLGHPLAI